MGRDWLVSPYMPHREKGGVNGAHITGASCQPRIAFLLICISADIMTNEEHAAYFNRSEKGECRVDESLEQVMMLRHNNNSNSIHLCRR